ncbi:cytochrome P450 [Streptomyces noursei]|uniref:cytochrome P450 n=1 Tax=Streptomyces noursei TaxID=1971 RepID=UPI0033FCB751
MSTQCAPATTPTGPACFPPCPTPRLRAAHDRAPETFDPDRWNSPRLPPPRHAVIPFAAGARKCIGDTYAMTEATSPWPPSPAAGVWNICPANRSAPPWARH